jgi:hypothetical protein
VRRIRTRLAALPALARRAWSRRSPPGSAMGELRAVPGESRFATRGVPLATARDGSASNAVVAATRARPTPAPPTTGRRAGARCRRPGRQRI